MSLKYFSGKKTRRILCKICRRWASKSFRKTVNLPTTSFPLSMKGNIVHTREQDIQKKCNFDLLYKWQESDAREKIFILHDGPPYANGKPHVGHAINKILKDVTNRYKLLQGHKIRYVPGWDCHGLPIEQKALGEVERDHKKMHPMDIRKAARKFAENTIQIQKTAFINWGVMADWKNCYFTFDKEFEAMQLEVFFQMYEKGLIYEDYMPVYWSPSSRTALAEAELEYNEKHKSTAVYVQFPLIDIPDVIKNHIGSERCFLVIWTTTPWTLPANKATCYGYNISYTAVKDQEKGDLFIISSSYKEEFSQLLGKSFTEVCNFEGKAFEGATYEHPLFPGSQFPLLPARHVTTTKGTGLVHTAPAHGSEDFLVAVKYNLPVECNVDENGIFTKEAVCGLEGKSVLTEGNRAVIDLLQENILHSGEYQHSYPYDWRTNQPIILRASKQWFVNTSKVKDLALESLKDVLITPKSSANPMFSLLENRPYWCISRQRVWGVPIPVFYNTNTGQPLVTRESVDHLKSLFLKHGSDCWWTLDRDDLLPKSILRGAGNDDSVYERGNDILDIWFDSGSTWAAVLGDEVADLYLEGIDQYGGWFQSSLLTSVSVRNKAPYRSLLVHGFAVDEEGKKMSKSQGNVIDPDIVISGGKNKEKNPTYGVDVFRWWATYSHLDPQVYIGPTVLNNCHEQVFKVRKTLRYLLGNLGNFNSTRDIVHHTELLPIDRYMLHLLYNFSEQVTFFYENFNYGRVLVELERFTNGQVSNFYINATKDRLYCDHAESAGRRSGQTVMYHLLEILTKSLAPVLPHLAEEVYQYMPFQSNCDSIFKTTWTNAPIHWRDDYLAETFEQSTVIKKTFSKEVGTEDPVDFDVFLSAQPQLFQRLKMIQEELVSSSSSLCEVLQTSRCSLLSRRPIIIPDDSSVADGTCTLKSPDGTTTDQKFLLMILPSERFLCGRCQRYTAEKYEELCQRCHDVLAQGWES